MISLNFEAPFIALLTASIFCSCSSGSKSAEEDASGATSNTRIRVNEAFNGAVGVTIQSETVTVIIPANTIQGSGQGSIDDASNELPSFEGNILDQVDVAITDAEGNNAEINGSYSVTMTVPKSSVNILTNVKAYVFVIADDGSITSQVIIPHNQLTVTEDGDNYLFEIPIGYPRVTVVLAEIDDGASDPGGFEASLPPDTDSLVLNSATDNGIAFTWTEVAGASSYLVSLQTGSFPDEQCPDGRSLPNTLTEEGYIGLSSGTVYYVRVCTVIDGIASRGRTLQATTTGNSKNFHLMSKDSAGNLKVYYGSSLATADWNQAQIASAVMAPVNGTIEKDSSGVLHAVWVESNGGDVHYSNNSGGTFASATTLGSVATDAFADISIVPSGDVHVFYGNGHLFQRVDSGGGFGGATIITWTALDVTNFVTRVDASGVIHAFGSIDGEAARYSNSSSWSTIVSFNQDGAGSAGCTLLEVADLAMHSDNKAHGVYNCDDTDLVYAENLAGATSFSRIYNSAFLDAGIDLDSSGNAHIAFSDSGGEVRYTTNAGDTFANNNISLEDTNTPADHVWIVVDDANRPWVFYESSNGTGGEAIWFRVNTSGSTWSNAARLQNSATTLQFLGKVLYK